MIPHRISFSYRTRIRALYGLSVLVLLGGFALSLFTDDKQWFARTGGLVVVLAVFSIILSVVEQQQLSALNDFRLQAAIHLGSHQIRKKNKDKTEEEIDELIQKNIRNKEFQNLEDDRRAKLTFWLAESIPVVVGTLVTSFGDLLKYVL